ncbi:hypothetical protein EXT48_04355 [Pseudoalteromonas sp. CO348]|uniref:hypothetical protein n=1 Tax=Pseudoalteromonas TaxID=53246 RepID=UPI0010233217|nr:MULTISPECIES: hypothetical protein [Pseudoalteromonas]QZO11930.1 hypothetical protein K5642_12515 [Pseudoalteromonas piscicida]RZG08323.1 hypothetical protein EXT48_04355 [Pseudoalteromonas sp. CO348]
MNKRHTPFVVGLVAAALCAIWLVNKIDNNADAANAAANVNTGKQSNIIVLTESDTAIPKESQSLERELALVPKTSNSLFDFPLRPLEELHDIRELESEYDFVRAQLESKQAVEKVNDDALSTEDIAALKRAYTHLNQVTRKLSELQAEHIEREFTHTYGENAFAEDMRFVRNTVAETLEKRKQARREWKREIEKMENQEVHEVINEENEVR